MTEKRFTVDGLTITENSPKGRKYLLEYQGGVNALCNRINGLFNKSKRLEKENKAFKYKYDEQSNEKMGLEEDIDRLLKENNELKEENEFLKCRIDDYKSKIESNREIIEEQFQEYKKLEKENKQLKFDNFNLKVLNV